MRRALRWTTIPNTLEEARPQIDAPGSASQKLEADLAVAKAELHQALTREKPAKRSQAILSKSRYITQVDLEGARHAQETPPTTGKRKSKSSTEEAPSKRSHPGQRETDQDDVILADDSEVERKVDEVERLGGGGWRRVQMKRGNHKMKKRRGMRGFCSLKLQQIYVELLGDLPL